MIGVILAAALAAALARSSRGGATATSRAVSMRYTSLASRSRSTSCFMRTSSPLGIFRNMFATPNSSPLLSASP